MSVSGLKDIDREIMSKMTDKDVLNFCAIDKRTWNEVCDDTFLKRRLSRYPGIDRYAKINETWKQFYLRTVYYISKMKEDYNFDYISGNFVKQYSMLKLYSLNRNKLLSESSKEGELDLVKYALKKGADIHFFNDYSLKYAVDQRHLDVVKYLIEHGADIHIQNERFLQWAVSNGYLDIVKYLVQHGSIITPKVLRLAEDYPEILEYLSNPVI